MLVTLIVFPVRLAGGGGVSRAGKGFLWALPRSSVYAARDVGCITGIKGGNIYGCQHWSVGYLAHGIGNCVVRDFEPSGVWFTLSLIFRTNLFARHPRQRAIMRHRLKPCLHQSTLRARCKLVSKISVRVRYINYPSCSAELAIASAESESLT